MKKLFRISTALIVSAFLFSQISAKVACLMLLIGIVGIAVALFPRPTKNRQTRIESSGSFDMAESYSIDSAPTYIMGNGDRGFTWIGDDGHTYITWMHGDGSGSHKVRIK